MKISNLQCQVAYVGSSTLWKRFATGPKNNLGIQLRTYSSYYDFLEEFSRYDVAIFDCTHVTKNDIQFIHKASDIKIVLSGCNLSSDDCILLLKLGVRGIFDDGSDSQNLSQIFKSLKDGYAYLSPKYASFLLTHFKDRDTEVLSSLPPKRALIAREIVHGFTYKEIAFRNHISIHTVRDHVKKIYQNFEVNSRDELREICA